MIDRIFLDVLDSTATLIIATMLLWIAAALLSIRRIMTRQLEYRRLLSTQNAVQPSEDIARTMTRVLSAKHSEEIWTREPAVDWEVLRLLNYLEYIALGVRREILDEKLVRDSIGPNMVQIFRSLRTPVYEMRSVQGSPVFIELESLVRKWEKDGIYYHDYLEA